MFDGNSGDDGSSGLPGDKKFPQPPFLQRSVSAPAIAEHVSEAIIPAFKYDAEEELRLNLSYQFPSRMNPRLPQSKKTGSDEGESAYAHLFGESNQKTLTLLGDDNALPAGLISSLMSDQPRTPLDLIQADFPSTPSSIYSKHILRNNESRLEEDMQAAELKVASITEETSFINQTTTKNNKVVASTNGSIPPLIASPSTGEDSLDHTAKAFQTLYVSSSSDLNQLGAASASAPLLSQFHSNQTATGSFFSNGSPVPPAAATSVSSTTANNSSGTTGTTTTSGTGTIPLTMLNAVTNFPPVQETVLPFASAPSDARISLSATTSNNLPVYSGILGGPPSVAGNQTVATSAPATVATSVASVTPPILTTPQMNNHHNAGTGPSMAQQPTAINMMPPLSLHPSQQGGHFYIPQIYLAANGQPIYYRNVATGQFPEFMYAPNLVDQNGLQINSSPLIADPNQIHLQQQAQLGAYLTPFSLASISGGPVQTAYWPSSDPSLPQTMAYPSAMRMVAEDPSRAGLVYQTNMAPYPNALTSVHPLAIQSHLNRSMAPPPANPPGNAAYPLSVPTPVAGMPGMIPRSTGLSHPSPSLDQSTAEELGGGGGREGVGSSQSQSSSFRGGGGREHHSHNHHQNHHNNHNNNHHNHRSHVNQRGGGGQHHLSSSSLERGGGGSPVRDGLVEEFRSTFGKSRQWTLRDLSNHIVAFCQDQHGSRFIQQKLEICSDSDKQLVFDEIFPSAQTLMTDVFGNYVLQKLFEYGSVEQCESLASLLKGQAVQLSMQMYGCRVVQKALEYVTRERLVDLVSEFDNPQMLIRCVHDSNGNHVIQKCIEIVSKAAKEAESKEMMDFLSGKIQFIIDAFKGRVKELSSHPYGCRVVQRILEHCADNQKAVILEELRGSCGELVQDCYGNYVIQFVMQHGWEADRAVLIKEVQEHLLDYSQHKFASNVVEKCLQFASKRDRDEMIWTIINVTFDLNNPVDSKGHCVLESMVRDPYANYVVQKVIDVSDEKQRAAIMRYVKDNITQLRKYTYGKHIIVRLEKITNEKF